MNDFKNQLSRSALAFKELVVPVLLPQIGGGIIEHVEAVTTQSFKNTLDQTGGIDAWQVRSDQGWMRGIASRVQLPNGRTTFTIRTKTTRGGKTELEKRHYAICHKDKGLLYPHLTVQAYANDNLESYAAVHTDDLIDLASRAYSVMDGMPWGLTRSGHKMKTIPDSGVGLMQPSGENEFMWIEWDYIESLGIELIGAIKDKQARLC